MPLNLKNAKIINVCLFIPFKVFLHHLNPLLSLQGFLPIWLTVLDLLRAYMHADNSENLYEAIPESLKNMLLVMASAGVLQPESYLWTPTWRAIDMFLPTLKNELFPEPTHKPTPAPSSPPPPSTSPPLTQSPSNLADTQSEVYSQPVPPNQALNEKLQQQQHCGTSAMSPSLVSDSDITSTHFLTPSKLPEVQQHVSPVKIVMKNPTTNTKDSQQVTTLVNQQLPGVSSPVAVQPAAHVYNLKEQQGEYQQAYQVDYKHQIGLEDSNSPLKSQHAHLPQTQDFNKVTFTDPVKITKQSEVSS